MRCATCHSIIDKDRSGELTVEELMTMFSGSSITGETGVNEEELKKFFAEAKPDGSNSTRYPHHLPSPLYPLLMLRSISTYVAFHR